MKIISIVFMVIFNLSCSNTTEHVSNKPYKDTLLRPAHMTQQATLLNYGSEEEPILVWADFIGSLSLKGKKYSHIIGVQYFYVKSKIYDTLYYENLKLRDIVSSFDFKSYAILNYPGDAMIQISNKKDTLFMFCVLESDEFKREHRGIKFKRMPTITFEDGKYIADVEMEFNIKETKKGEYLLTLNDGSHVEYKICLDCHLGYEMAVSFLNRQNGRIYLPSRDCYLELSKKDDLKKLQGLR